MSPPKEIEIKLQLPSANFARLGRMPLLRRAGRSKRSENQVSVYFDTKRLKLKDSGLTLRVRRTGNRYIQTIKSDDGGPFERGEWEAAVDDSRPDLNRADTSALEPLGIKKLRKRLRPVFETRVQRTRYPLTRKDCDIALTIDRGEIDAGNGTLPLCEAELELKRGTRARLFEFARSIARATSGELAVKSKSQRGYELLAGENAAVAKGEAVDIAPDLPASAAFQSIGFTCLKQIVANKPAILAGDPEGIHQMRVGLRRLRAAISLFSDIVAEAEVRDIKRELKWLTSELGPAREFDVFLNRVVAPLEKSHSRLTGMRSLSQDLADRRDAAVARALTAVCSRRFRDLTLDLAAWLDVGGWREPQNELSRRRCEQPIKTLARAQLTRRWKKIRKRGRMLAKLDAQARHKLRIQAKKLRYAAEFYGTVFPGKKKEKRRESFLSALKDMQDCFGDLNDVIVHEKLTTRLAKASAARSARPSRRIFAAGLLTGHEEARFKPLLSAAEHAFREFEKLKPYWN
ncbi:MAG TPA: CHAD domain-containing protein [Bradyrhizobium sp.]|nr:CHAD domain-containing protein [Bradyrhizobium sp.]